MSATKPSARFRTTLTQAEGKKATGIIVPPEVIEELAAGKRPAVRATVNGHAYRTTIGVMSGRSMISVSAAVRDATGLAAGDEVEVELVVDDSPRGLNVPDDFAGSLKRATGARDFFDGLANSLQRYHVDHINAAKTPETRRRRIDKAVARFLEGKQR